MLVGGCGVGVGVGGGWGIVWVGMCDGGGAAVPASALQRWAWLPPGLARAVPACAAAPRPPAALPCPSAHCLAHAGGPAPAAAVCRGGRSDVPRRARGSKVRGLAAGLPALRAGQAGARARLSAAHADASRRPPPPTAGPSFGREEDALGEDMRPIKRPVLRLPGNDDTLLTRIEPDKPVSSMVFKLRWVGPCLPACLCGCDVDIGWEGVGCMQDWLLGSNAGGVAPPPPRLASGRPPDAPPVQAQLARHLELPGRPDRPQNPPAPCLQVSGGQLAARRVPWHMPGASSAAQSCHRALGVPCRRAAARA